MFKKIKKELLREIRNIANLMKSSDFVFCADKIKFNAIGYTVILKDGTLIPITPGSYWIPNFKYKDVVFVEKQCYDNHSYEYIDTDNGKYNSSVKEHNNKRTVIFKKYKVTTIIHNTSDIEEID